MAQASRAGGVPLYQRIAADLRESIAAGDLPPGSTLPSESQLMERYGTTNKTVRKALALLGAEGLTEARHGSGVFVRRRPLVRRIPANRFEQARQAGRSLFETEVLEQGHVPTRTLIRVGPEAASREIAERLRVQTGVPVMVRRRLMLVDGEPVKVTASFFLMDLARDTRLQEPQIIDEGMHIFMERTLGRQYGRYTVELSARMPTAEKAALLRLSRGTPVLRILHSDYDLNGEPLEVVESIFAADKHVFVTEWPDSTT